MVWRLTICLVALLAGIVSGGEPSPAAGDQAVSSEQAASVLDLTELAAAGPLSVGRPGQLSFVLHNRSAAAQRVAVSIPATRGVKLGAPTPPADGWELPAHESLPASVEWSSAVAGKVDAAVDLWLQEPSGWVHVGRYVTPVHVYADTAIRVAAYHRSAEAEGGASLRALAGTLADAGILLTLLDQPVLPEHLEGADVILVSEPECSLEELSLLAGYVQSGGSLVVTATPGETATRPENHVLAAVGARLRFGAGEQGPTKAVVAAAPPWAADLPPVLLFDASTVESPDRGAAPILYADGADGRRTVGACEQVGKGTVVALGASLVPTDEPGFDNRFFVAALFSWLGERRP